MANIRDSVFAAEDIDSQIVDIPEWGVKVEIRGMTGRDRAAFQRQIVSDQFDMERWYTDLAIASIYDPETGEKVFDIADRASLAEKSAKVLERIADIATQVSGMKPGQIDQAEKELGEAGS